MKRYMAKKLTGFLFVMLGVTMITFMLIGLAPGDAAQKRLTVQGIAVTQELIEQEQEALGLNQPLWKQYGSWLARLLHGDLGRSYQDGQPVLSVLLRGLEQTLRLTALSLLLAILISVPLGVLAAVRQEGNSDYFVRFLAFFINGIPNFLFAVLLMYVFCVRLKWFPVIAKNSVRGLCLPVLCLALPLSGRFIRQIRVLMLTELSSAYVAGARGRGVRDWYILYKNALHNCMISFLTFAGLSTGGLIGGSVVVETIFGWPGTGKLVMDAINARDYPVIQGYVLIMAAIYTGINLLTDMGYHYLDPRIGGSR